jgi:Uma2 family endonuclease
LATLRAFFESTGRRVYVSSELAVYYPAERRFAPDLFAVCDVETHKRGKWVVSHEKKGLDFVMEVHVLGDSRKDLELNVARYARLGIPEYFIYDRGRQRLHGFRLPHAKARTYEAVLPSGGRLPSRVLGLDLVLEEDRLRFYQGTAYLLESRELVARLERIVQDVEAKADRRSRELAEAEERARAFEERAAAEAERAAAEAERAAAEAERAAALEARLAEYEKRFGPLG